MTTLVQGEQREPALRHRVVNDMAMAYSLG